MFYIAYKSDGITACKKQISLSRLTEVGKTKSGTTLYCTPSAEKDGAPYRWFYTVKGISDLLDRVNISPYVEPEQVRTILDGMSESQAAQAFPDTATKLEQIKLAIVNKDWTSNADALFCEIFGDLVTANAVRRNRAEYRARQNEEEEQEAAAEQERIAKQKAEEELAEKQMLDKAETDLKAGKFISPAMFEKLTERYGIPLPAKFLGWLRQWCGDISINRHTEELPPGVVWENQYDTVYYYTKGHKSSSLFSYADKLAQALGI